MPHLSPMNWMMAIIMFWFTLMMITSKLWWNALLKMPFMIPSTKSTNKSTLPWKWNY